MKTTIILAILTMALLFAPIQSSAAQGTNSITTGIVQTIQGVGTFTGSLTTTSFQLVNGVINAVGTISGTLTSTTGQVIGTVTNAPISVPLTGLTGSCPILSLHTGQINLALLGLNVVLSPIDLNITAQSAPGNLLGNLLCAVAHLLDTNGPLTGLVALLNQILAAL
jgi:hypothetical protein